MLLGNNRKTKDFVDITSGRKLGSITNEINSLMMLNIRFDYMKTLTFPYDKECGTTLERHSTVRHCIPEVHL